MYVGHRAPARREQRFDGAASFEINSTGASRSSTTRATTLHRTLLLVLVLLTGICPIALGGLALSRLNEKPFSDDGYMVVWLSLMLLVCRRGGDRRLVYPPADTGCCVAAQTPRLGIFRS